MWKIKSCFITLLHKKKKIRKYRQEDLLLMFEVIVEQIHRAVILLPQWRSVSSHTASGKPSVYCHQHELVISVCICAWSIAAIWVHLFLKSRSIPSTNSPHCLDNHCLILLDLAELRPAVLLEIIRAKAYCLTMVVLAHLEVRLAKPCESNANDNGWQKDWNHLGLWPYEFINTDPCLH